MESNYTDTISGEELYVDVDRNGTKYYFKDKEMTFPHRIDGPAFEYGNGGKAWYVDGQLHRVDGPAFEYVDGTKVWYVDGKPHRLDGPTFESADGTKSWYINGVFIFEVNKNNKVSGKMR